MLDSNCARRRRNFGSRRRRGGGPVKIEDFPVRHIHRVDQSQLLSSEMLSQLRREGGLLFVAQAIVCWFAHGAALWRKKCKARNAPPASITIVINDKPEDDVDAAGTAPPDPVGAETVAPALALPFSAEATTAVGVEEVVWLGLLVALSPFPKTNVVALSSNGSVVCDDASDALIS
jgi:hypothetical protein